MKVKRRLAKRLTDEFTGYAVLKIDSRRRSPNTKPENERYAWTAIMKKGDDIFSVSSMYSMTESLKMDWYIYEYTDATREILAC